jgi:uncharacterized membrane protein
MSEDFKYAIALLLIGVLIIAIGAYLAFRQKTYVNPQDNSVMTEVDIPFLGKVKTNIPAIALCFIGLVPVYFGYKEMTGRDPQTVTFTGQLIVDSALASQVRNVSVGITSSSWSQLATPSGPVPVSVQISVPANWQSYTAYAFPLEGANTRPIFVGTSLGNPKFELKISP